MKPTAKQIQESKIGACFLFEEPDKFQANKKCTIGFIKLTDTNFLTFQFDKPNQGTVYLKEYVEPFYKNFYSYRHDFLENPEEVRKLFMKQARRFQIEDVLCFGCHPVFDWISEQIVQDTKGTLEDGSKYYFASTKEWAGLVVEKSSKEKKCFEVQTEDIKLLTFDHLLTKYKGQ